MEIGSRRSARASLRDIGDGAALEWSIGDDGLVVGRSPVQLSRASHRRQRLAKAVWSVRPPISLLKIARISSGTVSYKAFYRRRQGVSTPRTKRHSPESRKKNVPHTYIPQLTKVRLAVRWTTTCCRDDSRKAVTEHGVPAIPQSQRDGFVFRAGSVQGGTSTDERRTHGWRAM